ncbi:MAG: glycosyltransferase N-terminal domain-containing protein [Candidatus Pedobacter colombiensis]|uniref:3-deoxy-D-manno-octulosonic acid transferase n=1 Tax=Candidatus Pedobacter colombiensis TaxID=3121371 RepID=A0AAJ6B6A4_9SPHI|nr:glycosyltransferase N-terminal domain-containing protein [Pedobacter sp.]WEK18709.1 MAG: glycosyltransferase N-terminal domain-containing protein [Pedobacter sp.]
MLWLYNIAIQLYSLIIRILSPFNTKASFFIKGRQNIFARIEKKIDATTPHIWFHFASLGEFEQGRPVLEKLKEQYPLKKIIVTFFSPSGYEIRKNYTLAEGVFYLPLDTASNAKRLIEAFNPELAIFTKYEYWYYYFKELHSKNIPLLIISGIFRPNQIFFKVYGSFHRKILTYVSHFFVQNEESIQLLKTINIQNATLSGDTRFDRVAENAAIPKKLTIIEKFCGNAPVLIAGSTWPEDERLIALLCTSNPEWKFIIAPHEIGVHHINEIEGLFPQAIKYSTFATDETSTEHQILIIDNIGMLSALYAYGKVAYIGGGFGAGIHNTLEAAAFGIPVIFGPKYDKFQEAKDLITLGAAKSINNINELKSAFAALTASQHQGDIAKQYVTSKTGSTDQILQYLSKYFKT